MKQLSWSGGCSSHYTGGEGVGVLMAGGLGRVASRSQATHSHSYPSPHSPPGRSIHVSRNNKHSGAAEGVRQALSPTGRGGGGQTPTSSAAHPRPEGGHHCEGLRPALRLPLQSAVEGGGGWGGGAGAGGGFDCSAFVKGLTYLFDLLLSYRRKAVVAQAGLLVASQLRVVVDKGNFGGDDNNGNEQQRGRYAMNHRHSVLKDLNELLSNLSVGVRTGLRRQCSTLFTHLPGLLKEAGDYDTQASIVELMYRLTTSTERSHSVTQWFPELECTVQCLFLTISEFDPVSVCVCVFT
ncbi:uncharacterized protein LOC126994125 [Eriocheir sinensis]|uniref:uncharacterized protein LOC126994125 n=1 Tax=Eriocheir sinensis TaxID=95602 RepID=UPI0021C5D333|nr:uncharacterized protein LOC126994125 [Eriocheir sinensis]